MRSVAKCRSCGCAILWAVTLKGKRIPIDPHPVAGGNLIISVGEQGGPSEHLQARAYEPLLDSRYAEHRFQSHFASCPNADEHRKGAK